MQESDISGSDSELSNQNPRLEEELFSISEKNSFLTISGSDHFGNLPRMIGSETVNNPLTNLGLCSADYP